MYETKAATVTMWMTRMVPMTVGWKRLSARNSWLMFLGTTPGRTRMGREASRNTLRMCDLYSLTSAEWLTLFLKFQTGELQILRKSS